MAYNIDMEEEDFTMLCGKCGKGCSCRKGMLCPFSFGLAVGIVFFFAVLIEALWVMQFGLPPFMEAMHMPMPTLQSSFIHALTVLAKGFLLGFFIALIYDLIRSCCHKKSDEACVCDKNVVDKK